MKKKISGKICVTLLLLVFYSPIRSIVKENNLSYSNLNQASSKTHILDTLKIDSKTRIYGNCFSKDNPYYSYSFMLKDSATIAQFAKSLVVGDKVRNTFTTKEFNIWIVNNHLLSSEIAIMPDLGILRMNTNSFKFSDFEKIKELHKKHPLESYEKKISFSNQTELNNYVTEIKKDTNLMYYYIPKSTFEGSFNITAKKSKIFNSPKAVMDYLSIEIEKIVRKGEYLLLSSVNLQEINKVIESDSYTITILGSKKLFDNLAVDEIKKNSWKPSDDAIGTFYMKR